MVADSVLKLHISKDCSIGSISPSCVPSAILSGIGRGLGNVAGLTIPPWVQLGAVAVALHAVPPGVVMVVMSGTRAGMVRCAVGCALPGNPA